MQICNWGKYPVIETTMQNPGDEAAALECASACTKTIGRGLGRCYGDSALNDRLILSSRRLDHMLDFNPETGVLLAESGVSLAEIVEAFAPRGWFVPVTPGTKFVSLGGPSLPMSMGKTTMFQVRLANMFSFLTSLPPKRALCAVLPTKTPIFFMQAAEGTVLQGSLSERPCSLCAFPVSGFVSGE